MVGPVLDTAEQKRNMSVATSGALSSEMRRFINSKASLSVLRPAIVPRLVLEFKAFPIGFTPQQHSVHFRHVLEDLGKLKEIASACADGRGIVLFDGDGYLTETRLSAILETRDRADVRIRVYLCAANPLPQASWHRH